ncbi:hypothetical protein BGW41_000993 [Actinomortierella wolfii]|nr:hypothetical protein BGW41_000993 [Actinomortierella wolfii]
MFDDYSKDESAPIVSIPGLGYVQGERDASVPVVRYLGIPFAKVHKRWNPPSPIEPWSGILDATKLGPAPPGPTTVPPLMSAIGAMVSGTYEACCSEKDCLNLNIFAPTSSVHSMEASHPLLPVMVWIYGGGFRCGGNNAPLYDFTNFVAASVHRGSPIIVVCINHRQGDFGFLASRELKEDIDNDPTLVGEQKAVGNWGLQDQKLAFLWIRDHIAAFHGNPNDITAVGSSSGAVSVGFHIQLPAHHGLFHKAIIQSSAPMTCGTQDIDGDGQQYFDRLCQHFGIPKDTPAKDKIARLRALPEKDLAAYGQVNGVLLYRPTVDGVLIDQHAAFWYDDPTRLDPGLQRVLLGLNRDEASASGAYAVKKAEYWPAFRTRLGGSDYELGREFDKIYDQPMLRCGNDSNKQAARLSMRIIGEGLFHAPVLGLASTLLRKIQDQEQGCTVQTSMYFFDCTVEKLEKKIPGLGASHTLELLYLINSAPCQQILMHREQTFTKQVQNVWLEFVANSSTATNPKIVPRMTRLWTSPTMGMVKEKDEGSESKEEVDLEKNVIVFRRDHTIGRSFVDWISKERFEYWMRFYKFQRDRLAQGDYYSHGLSLSLAPEVVDARQARL